MSSNKTHNAIPKSIPVKWFSLLIAIFIIALSLGVFFAKPINSTIDKLKPVSQEMDHEHEQASTQYYTCGMHPWIILPKPGNCPICQMKLTPLDTSKFTGEIAIDPVIIQNMGVRTAPVTTGPLVQTLRTVGTVDYNETLVRDINIKISGWIEKLHIDYLGAKVNEGDNLLDLYSPELYSAQQEYLIAQHSSPANASLLESARTRLRYFDVTDQQIATLEKENKPSKTLAIQSPYTGVVIAKKANEGMKVDAGTQVFRIADLSKIWVIVTLYEYQLPYIQLGNKAAMSLPYIPGHSFEGSVIYIYPYLDKKTREVQIRLEFENPDGLLKPGMFANVTLENRLASDRILAPRQAIIDTGERKVAFVALGKGHFEPRTVMTGIQTENDQIEIVQGLKPGEQVVTSGQFLLDSEANIRAALARMIQGDSANNIKPAMNMAMTDTSKMPALPEPFAKALDAVMTPYLAIGKQLAADSIEHVSHHAGMLVDAMSQLTSQTIPGNEHFWHQHMQLNDAMQDVADLVKDSDIIKAREHYAVISVALGQLLKDTGVPSELGLKINALHCPMFRESQGGSHWLQQAGKVQNPYFGKSMIDCYDTQSVLPIAGNAVKPQADNTPATQPSDPLTLLNGLADTYLKIQHQLSPETMDGVSDQLTIFQKTAKQLAIQTPEKQGKNITAVVKASDISTRDIKTFRSGFADLSDAMITLINDSSASLHRDLYQAYCPMVKKNWVQDAMGIRNPYATHMLECGSIKAQLTKAPESQKASEK